MYVVLYAELNAIEELDRVVSEIVRVGGKVLSLTACFYEKPRTYSLVIGIEVDATKMNSVDELVCTSETFKGASIVYLGEELYSSPFLVALKGFEEHYGVAGKVFLFHLGFTTGHEIAKSLTKLKLGGDEILKRALLSYRGHGLGVPELMLYSTLLIKACKVRVYENFECKGRESTEPTGHFFRGFLAGILRVLWNVDVTVAEEKCIAKGDPYCEFVVSF
ncbi:MAG: hypothetical protein DRJ51_02815 [Thermoprotei archaeon]|nr:MAG: hypothetical protein DRJ51_02815 [Thermoprotei archaeon]RLF02598.1 MAG: hypothetical protein DRJ59_03225 [Thermoprotei archaeon]